MKVVVRKTGAGGYWVAVVDYTTLSADTVVVDGRTVELANDGILVVDALLVKSTSRIVEIVTFAGQLENLAWGLFEEWAKLK